MQSGPISGCHLNPAVSIGLWSGGKFEAKELLLYIIIQVLGAIVASGVIYYIAGGQAGFDISPDLLQMVMVSILLEDLQLKLDLSPKS